VVTHVVQSDAVHMLEVHIAGSVTRAVHTVVRSRSWQSPPPGTSHHTHRALFAHALQVDTVLHA
jgi:hypothetical protein